MHSCKNLLSCFVASRYLNCKLYLRFKIKFKRATEKYNKSDGSSVDNNAPSMRGVVVRIRAWTIGHLISFHERATLGTTNFQKS